MSLEGLKESLAAKPRRTAVAAVLVVLIALATWFAVGSFRKPTTVAPKGVYFAHEDTGELSIQPVGSMPPLRDAAGNPRIVRAVLYTTDGGKTKVCAYYEKYSDAAKAMFDQAATTGRIDNRLAENGLLVKLPEKDAPWVAAKAPEGEKVKANLPAGAQECSVVLP